MSRVDLPVDVSASDESGLDLPPAAESSTLVVIDVLEAEKQFRCVICLGDCINAHSCPKCGQLFCHPCLETVYRSNNSRSCPHCRCRVSLGSYVKDPRVEDYMKSLRTAKPADKPAPQPTADKCPHHPEKYISFYCEDCHETACEACWENDHNGREHYVVPLKVTYKEMRKELESELLPKINAKIGEFESEARSGNRHVRESRFNLLKREGDARVEEITSDVKKAWDEVCQTETSYFRDFDEYLRQAFIFCKPSKGQKN